MPSSEMWRRVSLVRTDISDERVTSVFRVERISELRTLVVTSRLNYTAKKHQVYEKDDHCDSVW
jgi:hypothetical protein